MRYWPVGLCGSVPGSVGRHSVDFVADGPSQLCFHQFDCSALVAVSVQMHYLVAVAAVGVAAVVFAEIIDCIVLLV